MSGEDTKLTLDERFSEMLIALSADIDRAITCVIDDWPTGASTDVSRDEVMRVLAATKMFVDTLYMLSIRPAVSSQ